METGESMKSQLTPITTKTIKTPFDSESNLLPQPLKGVVVVANGKRVCRYCQNWTGGPESITAFCKLPRPGNGFTVTGSMVTCSGYAAIDGADIPAHAPSAMDGVQGQAEHIELVPANHKAEVTVWGQDGESTQIRKVLPEPKPQTLVTTTSSKLTH